MLEGVFSCQHHFVDGDAPLAQRPVPLENGDATDAVPAHTALRSVLCVCPQLTKQISRV